MTLPGHETVGEALIRILADGSGLPHSIRDEFKDSEGAFREEGSRSHAAYREGFEEEERKHPFLASATGLSTKDRTRIATAGRAAVRDLNATMRRDKSKFDATGQFLASATAREFRKTIIKEVGSKDLGDRIFRNISKAAFRAGDIEVFRKRFSQIGPEIARALEEIRAEEKQFDKDRLAELARVSSEQRKRAITDRLFVRQNLIDQLKVRKQADKEIEDLTRRRSEILKKIGERDSSFERRALEQRIHDAHLALQRGDHDLFTSLRRNLDEFNDHAERGLVKTTGVYRRSLRQLSPLETKSRNLSKIFDDIAEKAGRAFGTGARNNFFNALGRTVEAVTRLTTKPIPVLLATLGELAGEFHLAAKRTDEFSNHVSLLQRVLNVGDTALQNAGQLLGFLTKSALGVVGGLGAIIVVAGPLAAALSSLAAAAVALSGAIAFGIAAPLLALLPVLGAVGAAVATLALVFAGLTADQKKALKLQLKPVIKDLNELRDTTRKALFSELPKQIPLLQKALNRLKPVFAGVGKALAGSFTGFLHLVDSPAFKKNFDSMSKFFPEAVTKLGKIFTKVFGGLSSSLRALVPWANKLLDSLVKDANTFFKFANSARGQNRIRDFMERAWTSAKKLWTTIKDLFKVVTDLLSAGRSPGNGLLDSINSSLERFDAFLNSTRGKKALASFFSEMKADFAALGSLLSGLGKAFAALNSDAGHKILQGVFKGLGDLLQILAQIIPKIIELGNEVLPPVIAAFKTLFGIVKPLIDFLSQHQTIFKIVALSIIALTFALKGLALAQTIGVTLSTLRGISGELGLIRTNSAGAVRGLAGLGIALAGITAGSQVSGGGGLAIGVGGGALGGALVGSSFGPWGAAVGGVIGGLSGAVSHFWGETSRAAQAAKAAHLAVIAAIKTAADGLRTTLEQDGNAIRALSKLQIATSLQTPQPGRKIGALTAAQNVGIDPRRVVKAASGDVSALGGITSEVAKRLHDLGAEYDRIVARNAEAIKSGQVKIEDLPGIKRIRAEAVNFDIITEALRREHTAVQLAIRGRDQLAESLGKLDLATRDASTQVLGYGTSLAGNSLETRRNTQFIRDHLTALSKLAIKQLDAGRSAGSTAQRFLNSAKALRKQLTDAHFAADAVDNLIRTYGRVPQSILTKLVANPTDANLKMIAVLAKMGLIGKGVAARILAKDDTRPGVDSANRRLHNILDPVVKIGADASQANGVLSALETRLRNLQALNLVLRANPDSPRPPVVAGSSAVGGKFFGSQVRRIAEAGPEAVVPLRRALSQVDPSVRALSAFAQGLDQPPGMARGGVVGGAQKVVHVGAGAITVVTPSTDPVAVARETLDRLVTIGGT